MAGGLSQVSAAQPSGAATAEADTAEASNIQGASLPEKQASTAQQDLAAYQAKLDAQMQKMANSLETRKSQVFDPSLMALAAGFLAPTRTGGFGESLGAAAGNYQKSIDQQNAEEIRRNQLELELRKGMVDTAKQRALGEASNNLITQTTNPQTGVVTAQYNPEAAKQLSQLTGDPKYMMEALAQQKEQQLQDVRAKAIVPNSGVDENGKPKSGYSVDPMAVSDLLKIGGTKEAAEFAKSVTELRKAGIFGADSAGTPFDALVMTATDPAVKAGAERLAKQFKNGAYAGKEEEADKLAEKYMQLEIAHRNDERTLSGKEDERAFRQMMANLSLQLHQTTAQNQDEIRRAQLKIEQDKYNDKAQQSQEAARQAGDAAQSVIDKVKVIANHPGRVNGLSSLTPTQLIPGTDTYNYQNELQSLKSAAFLSNVQAMRGLGSLSNKEGDKITDAIAKLNTGMSRAAFDEQLKTITETMERAKARAARLGAGPTANQAPAAAAVPHFYNNRVIVPNQSNTGWVYQDTGEAVK